jgi:hypothetical protein
VSSKKTRPPKARALARDPVEAYPIAAHALTPEEQNAPVVFDNGRFSVHADVFREVCAPCQYGDHVHCAQDRFRYADGRPCRCFEEHRHAPASPSDASKPSTSRGITTIACQVSRNSGHEVTLHEVVDIGVFGRLKIVIHSTDELNRSTSYAMVFRWSGSAWESVHDIVVPLMKTRPANTVESYAKEISPVFFREDRDELLRVALAVLGAGAK